jgi:hypothetical protein
VSRKFTNAGSKVKCEGTQMQRLAQSMAQNVAPATSPFLKRSFSLTADTARRPVKVRRATTLSEALELKPNYGKAQTHWKRLSAVLEGQPQRSRSTSPREESSHE